MGVEERTIRGAVIGVRQRAPRSPRSNEVSEKLPSQWPYCMGRMRRTSYAKSVLGEVVRAEGFQCPTPIGANGRMGLAIGLELLIGL